MKKATVEPKITKNVSFLKEFPIEARGKLPEKKILDLMPWDLVKELKAFAFGKDEARVKIAALDPHAPVLKNYIQTRFGEEVEWYTATPDDLAFILKNHEHDFRSEISGLLASHPDANGNLAALVDRIIKYGILEHASDIHIEPLRAETAVRFRVDGILHNMISLPKSYHQAIIARFKILANLKIDEYRRPQDGRIEPEEFINTSLRVSTVPTLYGEKIAMRVLDDANKNLTPADLGFNDEQIRILARNIEKPFGMIVTSGPTGSGKTTTLYSLLQMLKKDGINISTLEDPIEFSLAGVNQIQINTRMDLTFASGLRALLRQDPDVIMVGEIRDSETAIMAANAAITGHLVFTTMHTNDAASAFTRFLEMKVEDFVVSTVVNLVIAQRLVRKICHSCAKTEKLEPMIISKIRERSDIIAALENREKGISKKLESLGFSRGTGCAECIQTGYSGRIGIFEVLELNRDIHDLVLKRATAETIKSKVAENGFKDMVTDGIGKILAGHTTFDEVLRTTKEV